LQVHLFAVTRRGGIYLPQTVGLHLQCLRLHLTSSAFFSLAALQVTATAQVRRQCRVTALQQGSERQILCNSLTRYRATEWTCGWDTTSFEDASFNSACFLLDTLSLAVGCVDLLVD
jgi:hypothetical protein